jgi:hypothetical protein
MENKKLLLFIKIFAFLLPVFICYAFLYGEGYLPLLTNSISFDAKYYAIKKQQVKEAALVSIGSSMTLDDINSSVIQDSIKLSYYNFASWGMQISDINHLLNNYILTFKPRYIIICSSTPDFQSSGNISLPTDFSVADKWLPYFYFKNFNSILQVVQRKKELDLDQKSITQYTSLQFDNNGGVALDIKNDPLWKSRNERILTPLLFNEDQYKALGDVAAFLRTKHIKLFFIQAPVKLSALNTISGNSIDKHIARCKSILQKEGGNYLNYYANPLFADSLFADDFHLSGYGARLFTQQVVKNIRLN